MALIQGIDFDWLPDGAYHCDKIFCNWTARIWGYGPAGGVPKDAPEIIPVYHRYCYHHWMQTVKLERWRRWH